MKLAIRIGGTNLQCALQYENGRVLYSSEMNLPLGFREGLCADIERENLYELIASLISGIWPDAAKPIANPPVISFAGPMKGTWVMRPTSIPAMKNWFDISAELGRHLFHRGFCSVCHCEVFQDGKTSIAAELKSEGYRPVRKNDRFLVIVGTGVGSYGFVKGEYSEVPLAFPYRYELGYRIVWSSNGWREHKLETETDFTELLLPEGERFMRYMYSTHGFLNQISEELSRCGYLQKSNTIPKPENGRLTKGEISEMTRNIDVELHRALQCNTLSVLKVFQEFYFAVQFYLEILESEISGSDFKSTIIASNFDRVLPKSYSLMRTELGDKLVSAGLMLPHEKDGFLWSSCNSQTRDLDGALALSTHS